MSAAEKRDAVIRLEVDRHLYEVDIDDLDALEQSVLERAQEELGQRTGTIYGCLLVGKKRAGEPVDRDEVFAIKFGEITPRNEEAKPDPPARSRERGAK